MMFMKNGKRRKHPMLAVAVGALAVFGAYSMVAQTKEKCKCKINAMMNSVKKHKKSDSDTSCSIVQDTSCGCEDC